MRPHGHDRQCAEQYLAEVFTDRLQVSTSTGPDRVSTFEFSFAEGTLRVAIADDDPSFPPATPNTDLPATVIVTRQDLERALRGRAPKPNLSMSNRSAVVWGDPSNVDVVASLAIDHALQTRHLAAGEQIEEAVDLPSAQPKPISGKRLGVENAYRRPLAGEVSGSSIPIAAIDLAPGESTTSSPLRSSDDPMSSSESTNR